MATLSAVARKHGAVAAPMPTHIVPMLATLSEMPREQSGFGFELEAKTALLPRHLGQRGEHRYDMGRHRCGDRAVLAGNSRQCGHSFPFQEDCWPALLAGSM